MLHRPSNTECDTYFVERSHDKYKQWTALDYTILHQFKKKKKKIVQYYKMKHLPDNCENKHNWGYFYRKRNKTEDSLALFSKGASIATSLEKKKLGLSSVMF